MERLLQEQQKSKERIAALSLELARYMAEDREETEGNICVFDSVLDEVALRELVNLLMEKCRGIAAAFSGDDRRGYAISWQPGTGYAQPGKGAEFPDRGPGRRQSPDDTGQRLRLRRRHSRRI